jgi:isochorismate pyruvate lyase
MTVSTGGLFVFISASGHPGWTEARHERSGDGAIMRWRRGPEMSDIGHDNPARLALEDEETTMRITGIAILLGCLLSLAASAEEPTTDTPALWGSPTVDDGACCKTLGEVRSNIDRLDRDIVRLIAERGRYVHEAARFKANPAQVEAPERAEAVVRKAMALAEQYGLSPKVAEATYRAMVRGFINYEQEVFAAAAAAGQAPWKK